MFKLNGKTAIVTGGGSGIGRAISLLYAAQGAYVVILELNKAAGEQTVAEIKAGGGQAEVLACNVTNHQEVAGVFEAVLIQRERIDILVNNAGIAHIGNIEQCSEADFDKVYTVNVKGAYNCMQAAVKAMLKNNSGVIINMASIASSCGLTDRFAYSMSKGAMLTMTYSVAKDYVKKGIRCNSISPGRVHTPFVDNFIANNYAGREAEMFEKLSQSQPIGRMAKPEEVANLALFLASDEAAFITGTDYPIDGGFIKLNG